ncbi:MAG: TonB-dependent receptor [Prolixibacteraceae bacterium]|nr:TonB-dependent receptor [Prolixibacteraceae bacterium]
MKLKQILLFAFWMIVAIAGKSQTGVIKGTITDANTKESLIGATVVIQGTAKGASSDFDGNFRIDNVKAGSYNLVISYISYDNQIVRAEVTEGKETVLNFALKSASVDIDEVKVVAKRRDNTEVSMVSSLKAGNLIVSGISAQQIGKSQDKDAAEVIRRVPGITITDGRFVIVRGLIERYNSVMLNGATAPSFEADKRAFSFDAIPSGMINNILIYKSPAPELPADFAGAAINVETKSNADENSLVIAYNTKYVEHTTFNNKFQTYQGGKTDWLGYDDGTRDVPKGVPSADVFKGLYTWKSIDDYMQKTTDLVKVSKLFSNNWESKSKAPLPDQSLSITLQRRFVLGKVSLGNISSFSYNSSSDYLKVNREEYQDYSESQNRVIKDFDFHDQKSKESTKIGFIHNWNLLYGNNQKLEFRNLVNQMGNKTTNIRDGVNYYNVDTIHAIDLRYESRFIYSGQLAGEQHFNHERTKFNWMAGYGYTKNSQPDNRRLTFILDNNQNGDHYNEYFLRMQNVPNAYLGGRLWLNLNENIYNYKADLEHLFKIFNSNADYTLKAGVSYERKKREFSSRLIGAVAYNNPPDIFYKPASEIFSEENIYFDQTAPFNQDGITYRDNTAAKDSYDGEDKILAGYIGLKIPISKKINAYGGVRFEKFNRKISNFYEKTGNTDNLDIVRDTINYFPSINLTYNINDKNLFRFSYGKTINRPEFREMSNFDYQDFDMFAIIHGNDTLKSAYIDNYDLRYEWYPSAGEVVSLAAFYKDFTDPIEVFLIPAGTGYDYKPFNTEKAYSMGLELDARKQFTEFEHSSGFLNYLKNLTVIFNTSLIKSQINTSQQGFARDKKRIMQGQSPYIINLGLNYTSEASKFNVGVNFNRLGKRIAYVGNPLNPHTWELPRNSLDLTIQKELGKRVTFKAGVKDILNNPVRFVQYYGTNDNITVDTYNYTPNRSFSAGIVVKL